MRVGLRGEIETHLLGIGIPLGGIHDPAALVHHCRHSVHAVVRLDLRGRKFRHVGHLVHLLGKRLLGQEHLGLLISFLVLALLQEILDLFLEDRVLFGGLACLAAGLLGLETSLKLDLHIAGLLAVRHGGGWFLGIECVA